MLSIAEATESLVKRSPYLSDSLADGIINLSALARILHEQIQSGVKKDIKEGAIVAALKRLGAKLRNCQNVRNSTLRFGDMTVRSNLVDITYTNSGALGEKLRRLFQQIGGRADVVCSISQGTFETTVIASATIQGIIEKLFEGEKKVATFTQLSTISIALTRSTTETPGSYAFILKTLAWEGINIIEVISTFRELTIVVRNEDIERAFSTLKRTIT